MLRAGTVIALLALSSCSPEGSTEPPFEEAGEAASGSLERPLGTFVSTPGSRGELDLLTLEDNGSYHAVRRRACASTPCAGAPEDGRYRLSERRGVRLLALSAPGRDLDVHRYQARGEWLSLAPASRALPSQSLTRAEVAWCAAPSDCDAQALPRDPCPGYFRCEDNACSYACGRPSPVE